MNSTACHPDKGESTAQPKSAVQHSRSRWSSQIFLGFSFKVVIFSIPSVLPSSVCYVGKLYVLRSQVRQVARDIL